MNVFLVVVESPNKVKKVKALLSQAQPSIDFRVVATCGHFRDLPRNALGVNLESFEPTYEPLQGKTDVEVSLRRQFKGVTTVLLATDADREGEAIGWHVAQVLRLTRPSRLRLTELTPAGMEKAFRTKGHLDSCLVDAQQARRILDRLVGFKVTPLLQRIGPNHSVGRVQSAALHLVALREAERSAFKAVPYFTVSVDFEERFTALVSSKTPTLGAQPTRFPTRAEADVALATVNSNPCLVASVQTKERQRHPPPPFTTSSLQQAASSQLKLTPEATMELAQQLFEAGFITYHRTDSVSVSDEAVATAREHIAQKWPLASSELPVIHKSKAAAQEAHEAIRPTVYTAPDALLDDARRLFELIASRFLASQCRPATFAKTTVTVAAGPLSLVAEGEQLLTQSFLLFYRENEAPISSEKKTNAALFPPLAAGQQLAAQRSSVLAGKTQAPKRYTQASLIAELERSGIGRPSTYAQTLKVLFSREYVLEKSGFLEMTPRGTLLDAALMATLPSLIDAGYTARMESQLDAIADNKENWKDFLHSWWKNFSQQLQSVPAQLSTFLLHRGDLLSAAGVTCESVAFPCPRCGASLFRENRKTDSVVICSSQCGFILSGTAEPSKTPCPVCGHSLFSVVGQHGPYLKCATVNCSGRAALPAPQNIRCPKCSGAMLAKGTFFGCAAYPACRGTLQMPKPPATRSQKRRVKRASA